LGEGIAQSRAGGFDAPPAEAGSYSATCHLELMLPGFEAHQRKSSVQQPFYEEARIFGQ
jgi:hypothetical protein